MIDYFYNNRVQVESKIKDKIVVRSRYLTIASNISHLVPYANIYLIYDDKDNLISCTHKVNTENLNNKQKKNIRKVFENEAKAISGRAGIQALFSISNSSLELCYRRGDWDVLLQSIS